MLLIVQSKYFTLTDSLLLCRRPYIILRIPRSDQIFSEDIFDKTLEELRLFPQAKFIASALTPQQNAEQRLTEVLDRLETPPTCFLI